MGVAIQFTGDASQYIAEWKKVTQLQAEAAKEVASWAKAANAGVAGAAAQLKKYSEEWLKHTQTLNLSTKQYEQTTLKVGAFGASMGANRQAMMQWGYMIQDVSATVGTMGLAGGIKSVGDNAVYMAALLGGPVTAVWVSLGVAAATTLSGIDFGLGKTIDSVKLLKKTLEESNQLRDKANQKELPADQRNFEQELKDAEKTVFASRQNLTKLYDVAKYSGAEGIGRLVHENREMAIDAALRGDATTAGVDAGVGVARGAQKGLWHIGDMFRGAMGMDKSGTAERTAYNQQLLKTKEDEANFARIKNSIAIDQENLRKRKIYDKNIEEEGNLKKGYQDELEDFRSSTKRGGPMYGKFTKKEKYETEQSLEGFIRASETIIDTNQELIKNLRNNPRADGANG